MKSAKLIIDSPEKNSSLLYSTGYFCIDPIIYLEVDSVKIGYFPATEFEKAKKTSTLSIIENLSEKIKEYNAINKSNILKSTLLIDKLKSMEITDIIVPESFPSIEFINLTKNGFCVQCKKEPFFESRTIKTSLEQNCIKDVSNKTVSVMDAVKTIIAESTINNNTLLYKDVILTAEYLQNFILKSFIDVGLSADAVIVSVGDQGCDPHERGYGPILPYTSIIVDIFPRSRSHYYFSDMTRTFCKGQASNELNKLYNDVKEIQQKLLDTVKPGITGKDVHKITVDFFDSKGYKSGVINGYLQGFMHGTGHGLGLDCHELPFVSSTGEVLEENTVITIEPGLYYKGIGGVRLEDTVVVKKDGVEVLTGYEKILEIP